MRQNRRIVICVLSGGIRYVYVQICAEKTGTYVDVVFYYSNDMLLSR